LDAKMCPDGSFVGRVAPTCEFATCSVSTGSTSTTVVTFSSAINQSADILGVRLMPTQVTEDSRCPSGVQCIWAGTVRLNTLINGQSTTEFTLNTPVNIGQVKFELVEVAPEKRQNVPISPSDYSFTMRATRIQ